LFFALSADIEIKCQRCKNIIKVKLQEQSEPHSKK
jgi:phage FluMu protein Com